MAIWGGSNRGYKLVALIMAALLWMVAHGSSSVEKGFDIPLVFHNVPEDVVITDQNSDVVNVRLQGGRAALRNVDEASLEYVIDASSAQPGEADFEVELSGLKFPRGAKPVSRSPSRIEVKFERRGTKVMRVRSDLEGEPAEGFVVAAVEVDPPRVRITGARREVFRLAEVVTEPIDVNGLTETVERDVHLALGGRHVWLEKAGPVRVRITVEPQGAKALKSEGKGG